MLPRRAGSGTSWGTLACPFVVGWVLLIGAQSRGADTEISADAQPDPIPMPTLGGMQFWADELHFRDWRIQRNVLSGHARLLDGKNRRHASGTFEECRAVLEEIKRQRSLSPMRGRAVVLLHGLGRTRSCMEPLAEYLRKQTSWSVFNVEYPSTRQSIAAHARGFARVLSNLEGIDEIDLVAHSLGNIVVRHYVASHSEANAPRAVDRRIKRMVMLGPPNRGSELADLLSDNRAYQLLTGRTGQELGRHWAWAEASLGIPPFEFGILAGGLDNRQGFNPLVPGDDDGIVSVEGTRLDGARDFALLPVLHLSLVHDARAMDYTLRFLRDGRFRSPGQRQTVLEK